MAQEFDFVADEALRRNLKNDYEELARTIEALAWKAAHVLAGSIIEAVLFDYLANQDPKNAAAFAKLSLGGLIDECRKQKIIQSRTADLASVVRDYRNLIHPGRQIRTSDRVDSKSAAVVLSLVDMIVDELGEKRKQTAGHTAAQLVRKIEIDPAAAKLVGHFIAEMQPAELGLVDKG